MGPDGKKKLSKRDGAKDLLDYRDEGYLPEALCNFLALIGWNPGGDQELFPPAELQSAFSLEKVQRSGGAFNEEKLKWMNKEYLQQQDTAFLTTYFADALPAEKKDLPLYSPDKIEKLVPIVFERISTKTEINEAATAGEYDWAFSTPQYDTPLLKWKQDDSESDALPRLQKLLELLTEANFESPETIKEAVWPYAEEVGRGQVLWPLRVALSGRERSPDPFTLAFILGSQETLSRIKNACDKIAE
jgi:glutamyl/glutaminyl-tRNA synthetase